MNWSAAAVGIPNTAAAQPLGTTLPAGVHLRWNCARSQGFPWHGYWVLRRNSVLNRPGQIAPIPAGPWQLVTGTVQPIGLPVYNAGYPPSAKLPGAANNSWGVLGKPRVKAGNAAALQAEFSQLEQALGNLIACGPTGNMAAVMLDPGAGVASAGDAQPAPALSKAPLLNWLALAALDPGMAQLLGLYVVDAGAYAGVPYDYAIVADFSNEFGSLSKVLDWAGSEFAPMTGAEHVYIGSVLIDGAAALMPPQEVAAYFLPRGSVASPTDPGLMAPPLGLVGLRWPQTAQAFSASSSLASTALQRFVVLRQYLAPPSESKPPLPNTYNWVALPEGNPIAMVCADGTSEYLPPLDWPPMVMQAIDAPPDEGWYAYSVVAVDPFGRSSAPSSAARWSGWKFSKGDEPWYAGQVDASGTVHAWAVRVLNKIPPPPPVDVVAELFDPLSDYPLDATAVSKFNEKETKSVFLTAQTKAEFLAIKGPCVRLRWSWRWQQSRQAPVTHDFRVYCRAGRFNIWPGELASLVADPASPGMYLLTVQLDAGGQSAKTPCPQATAFLGRTVTTGGQVWRIEAGLPDGMAAGQRKLRVSVATTSSQTLPKPGVRVALALPPPSVGTKTAAADPGDRTKWDDRLISIAYSDPAHCIVRFAPSANPVAPGQPLAGKVAFVNKDGWVLLSGAGIKEDGTSLLDVVCVGGELLWLQTPGTALAAACLPIIDIDRSVGAVRVAGSPPKAPNGSPWVIGEIVRDYEVFVATAALAVEPPIEVGLAWHTFGVSAADDRPYSGDAPGEWGAAGGLLGNEGRVAAAVPIVRVRRSKPGAPKPWIQQGPVYASRMDALGLSYHTYRWEANSVPKGARVQVMRALDETLFAVDWALRPRTIKVAADGRFIEFVALMGLPKEQAASVAAALQALDDGAVPKTKGIPPGAQAKYRLLSDLHLQALAALYGMEAAFQPVTVAPLDPSDCADKEGLDNTAVAYTPDPKLQAWQDSMSGASENRYVYASRTVDAVKNASGLSLPAVPVRVPRGRPLAAPVILRALTIPPSKPGGAWGAKIQWLAGDGAEEWIVRRRAIGADGQGLGPVVEVKVNGSAAGANGVAECVYEKLESAAAFEFEIVASATTADMLSEVASVLVVMA